MTQNPEKIAGGSKPQEGEVRPHPPASKVSDTNDPHTEENLDKGLEETFPASDPVSISPGAD